MSFALKLLSTLVLVAAFAGCSASNHNTGKPCERCSYGFAPGTDKRAEQRAVCIIDGKVVNCDKIPAECPECARIQRRDMDRDHPPAY